MESGGRSRTWSFRTDILYPKNSAFRVPVPPVPATEKLCLQEVGLVLTFRPTVFPTEDPDTYMEPKPWMVEPVPVP